VAELARGNVTDRPWGQTFGRLGSRGLTGQLNVLADNKVYSVAFARGAVVGASSPLANDALVRIALTGHLVNSTQVAEIARRTAAAPQRDEAELIAEIARLSPDQVQRLRRRAVAQRAARTFSVERGEFVVDDRVTVPVVPGAELDVRAVMYVGARGNLSEQRLELEVAQLGAWFKLRPEAVAELAQYGFSEAEKRVLRRLVDGGTLQDLAIADPQLDARAIRAIVYALAAYGACETAPQSGVAAATRAPRPSAPPESAATRAPRPSAPPELAATRAPRPSAPPESAPRAPAPAVAVPPVVPRASSPSPPAAAGGRASTDSSSPAAARPASPAAPTRMRRPSANLETEKLIASMVPLLERGADHFELLGVAFDAPTDQVRNAYFNLARKLHPDKLASLGIADAQRQAQRLFARINSAFATLTDPPRRAEYIELQRRGGEAAVREDESKVEELTSRVMRAEEAFKQGEMALRREQYDQAVASFQAACELQPGEPEYLALLAWAKFAAAPDKHAVAAVTRTALQKASDDGVHAVVSRFYLGRVERMLGREREALAHFQEVLRAKPHHAEAASEARILEQRLKGRR
jgi:curved DNA-binding protein CbpA